MLKAKWDAMKPRVIRPLGMSHICTQHQFEYNLIYLLGLARIFSFR